jgi:hypothetical protein
MEIKNATIFLVPGMMALPIIQATQGGRDWIMV